MCHFKSIIQTVRVLILLILSALSFQLQAQEVATQTSRSSEKEDVRVISYNILNGFTDDYEGVNRTEMFVKWIKEKDPEVLALQELTGFTQDKLEKLAESYGHPYALILKESGYAVGLTSKKPIELKKRMIEGMHHGTLHARTYGIDMLVIHLSPFDWKFRLKEARAICNYIEQQKLENYMVMGDFNAQSPLDADQLDMQTDLIKWMNEYDAKYDNQQQRDGVFDYSVLSTFLAFPMEDPAQLFVEPELRSTNPTRIWKRNSTEELKQNNRIDYMLVSPNLLKSCVGAMILQDATTDYLSDHYPVGIDMMLAKKQ